MKKRLYRNPKEGVLFGVCAGLADYLDFDPSLISILYILTILTFGAGIIAYLLASCLIPTKSA